MPQTFYTLQDEEILSLVGRLRSSELLENIFVIPKRALVLQSIVNLRMLAREAEKAGKRVVIVTQDENGRRLAEKAGIETRPYSEEAAREPEPVVHEEEPVVHVANHPSVSADSIGSTEFFTSPGTDADTAAPSSPVKGGLRIRIRDTSPKYRTALNSAQQEPTPTVPPVPPSVQAPARVVTPIPSLSEMPNGEGRLSRVFSSSAPKAGVPSGQRRPTPSRRAETHHTVEPKGKAFFIAFVALSLVFLIGTGAFILLPKAAVVVTPQTVAQDLEMDFEGRTDPAAAGDRIVPVRLIEKEETVTVSGTATGSASGSGSKSSGKIVIYNEYGAEPQQLVATTRFQTADGKVFRLTKGVTVPGVSDAGGQKKPGIAEAEVSADQPGDGYNVGPSEFSIPGFSGGPKAGKIYAKSTSAMSGGSTGKGGSSAVSATDLEKAKADAVVAFREKAAATFSSDLAADERLIPETIDIATVGSSSAPSVGSAAESFEYRVTFHGRAFVFSEERLRERAIAMLRKNSAIDDSYQAAAVTFRYVGGTSDFSSGTFRFRAGVNAMFTAPIDVSTLRSELLGGDEAKVKSVLDRHPEVKNIEIELKPKGLSFTVPTDPKRVDVTVAKP